jgi:transcriptional regulator of arginine metabolism
MKIAEPELLDTFKTLLQDQRFGSQLQLARALSLRGFENVTQTRVSRLLHKVGAIKIRNHNNDAVYRLPEKQHIPCGQQAIDSVVLDIKHNQV